MRNRWTLMALTLAVILAGGALGRAARAQGDPRVEGILPHEPVVVDPNILADPRTVKGRPAGGGTTGGPEATDTTPYPVKLDRPAVAGQTVDVVISSDKTTKTETTPPGATVPTTDNKETKAEISGRMAIVSVDKLVITEFNLTVKKFTVDGKEALPADKVINAKYDKTYTFTVASGEPLSEEAKAALDDAFGDSGDGDPFATDTTHKVGESWKLDSANAAKTMEKHGMTIDPKDITGQATFKALEQSGVDKGQRIEETMTAKNFKGADASQTIDVSEVNVKTSQLLPADATLPPADMSGTIDIHMHFTAPAVMDMTEHDVRKETITPVK